jgi:DNA mismatch repair protein MutS
VAKEKNTAAETPLMKQYNSIKAKYPDAVLLFRVGDFYETFGEDAVRASKVLGIVLTRRANGAAAYIELAGFPYHSLESYLPKLVRAGFRVAICEQLEDPKLTKTIVKRDVTELVSPGVTLSDNVLEQGRNNWLCSIHYSGKLFGLALLDISTGEFLISSGDEAHIQKLIQSYQPSELLYQREYRALAQKLGGQAYLFALESWIFDSDFAIDLLLNHFRTKSLKGFGIEDMPDAIPAAGAILHYLKEARHDRPAHILSIRRIDPDDNVWLDSFTLRNLEILFSAQPNGVTLFDVINRTLTPPGARTLRRRLAMPFRQLDKITERLDAVQEFLTRESEFSELGLKLKEAGDPERLGAKIATGRLAPRECMQLLRSLQAVASLKEILIHGKSSLLGHIREELNPCVEIASMLEKTIDPEAPVALNKGRVIKEGVNAELDSLRHIAYSGKDYLLQLQQREGERTGIPSLKVAFNNVFGYYIEVTNTHKSKVPEDWIRKQTLVNAERYITAELKEYEDKILGAEEKILTLETKLYTEVLNSLQNILGTLQKNAALIGELDCLLSFAVIAGEKGYTRPDVNEGLELNIKDGRHPVIETRLPEGETYIPNDLMLNTEDCQIIMITGPNMSGKSALLRQTALIVLLAQAGSFVPASAASVGICDKIFTRVGASDNLSMGESTFMVEMNETASILNNLSERSLILLDEIGRGTSTYDGISIARAIAEYLHDNGKTRPRTLFATHYHELNELEGHFGRIRNYHVAVKEINNKIVFLRKLIPGGSEHSFGIHVAEMAGMPGKVVKRAGDILKDLEELKSDKNPSKSKDNENFQLSFFHLEDPVLVHIREEVKRIDINTLTPVEALMKLNEIKKLVGL